MTETRSVLSYSPANSKLRKLYDNRHLRRWTRNGRRIYSLDLPAGSSCPFALICRAKAVQIGTTRKIVDGPKATVRCYAASQEALFRDTFEMRQRNFKALLAANTTEAMADLILSSLPKNAGIIRIHSSGDMFNRAYWRAWLKAAEHAPDVLFYGYTKAVEYWIADINDIPGNLILTASEGGTHDHLIAQHNLRFSRIIFSAADRAGLAIDNDDSHAARPDIADQSFALLIHGVQPAGTPAARAVQQLKQEAKQSETTR